MTFPPFPLQISPRLGFRRAKVAAFAAMSILVLSGGCGGGGSAEGGATGGLSSPRAVSFAWSDTAGWDGKKPVAGSSVIIPAGYKVELDEVTAELDELIVEGELIFKHGLESELKAGVVRVRAGGALLAGSAAEPFVGRATVTLSGVGTGGSDGMGTRGILVSGGGRLELYGVSPARPWTRLNAHANALATSLKLAEPVDWQPGDQIVIAPTEWYPTPTLHPIGPLPGTTEQITLAAASGDTLTLRTALERSRWGVMQYVTRAFPYMSTTPDPSFVPPDPDAVRTLDERAEVGNLSRNIVIQSADDDEWRNNRFGAQVMVMDLSSTLRLDGVELRRVGQEGKVGRYPIHWHLLSYPDLGTTELGDATGHFVRNSTVWNSSHRCMVVHGTNGVVLQNNICYDIKGHAIFLEDAVERRNVIEGNLVLKVRSPRAGMATVRHEEFFDGCGNASGYWLTNPDNTVRNNVAADAEGHGIWLSYPERPVKQGKNVPIRPHNLKHGAFEFNVAHSNGMNGLQLECVMENDAGNLIGLYYQPTSNGQPWNVGNSIRFTFKGMTTFKNVNGYLNRAQNPDYLQWANADNLIRGFTGAVQPGSTLKHSLIVGQSLNNSLPLPTGIEPQLAFASYHSTLDIAHNTIVNFQSRGRPLLEPPGTDLPSGAFGTEDYYLRPVEMGFHRNPGNVLINADPGYRALPPHLQRDYATLGTDLNWTLAGAVWDPQGYWSTPNRWLVFDTPFLSELGACTSLTVPNPNGLSCPGPYYGVGNFDLKGGLAGNTAATLGGFKEAIQVSRLDAVTYAPIANATWDVKQGYTSLKLGNMRHFAAFKGGVYVIRFPQFPNAETPKAPPRWVNLQLDNLKDPGSVSPPARPADSMMLGVHFDGAKVLPTLPPLPPARTGVFLSTSPNNPDFATNSRELMPAADRDAVAAGNGSLYWQDTNTDLVWVKLTGLYRPPALAGVVAGSDEDLFRSFFLRIE